MSPTRISNDGSSRLLPVERETRLGFAADLLIHNHSHKPSEPHCCARRISSGRPPSKFDNPSRKARVGYPGLSLFQLAALAAAISALGRHVMRTCAPRFGRYYVPSTIWFGATQGRRAREGVKPNRVLRLRGCFPNFWSHWYSMAAARQRVLSL